MMHYGKWFSVVACRAGWLVQMNGATLSHGHASRESAEDWVRSQIA